MQNLVLLPGWKPGSLHRRAVRCGVLATEPPGESRSFTLLTRPHTVVDWPHTVVDFPQGNLCSSEKKVRSKLLCEGSVQVSPGSGQWRNAVVREHCPRLGAIQPGAVLEMLRTVAPYILWFLYGSTAKCQNHDLETLSVFKAETFKLDEHFNY